MISEKSKSIVKSTAPVIAATGPSLIGHFYERMFKHHPELKDVFNMSNQKTGDQREALFNAVCSYAENIDNLEALLPAVERIANKHTSLLIQPEQYAIVGEHLLASIDELISPGQEVLDAWQEAYQLLANIFINREEEIYQQKESLSGGWRGKREFRLTERKKESDIITSFYFTPTDGKPIASYKPGQYIGVFVESETFENKEIRQYSLSDTPRKDTYRISVKREGRGVVSNYLHNDFKIGDTLMMTPPAGQYYLQAGETTPVTLISAGVGLTPTLSMLNSLTNHKAPVVWLHAAENSNTHAFRQHVSKLAENNDHISAFTWYNNPAENDVKGRDFDYHGLIDIGQCDYAFQAQQMDCYFCGPVPFMQHVARQLQQMGVHPQRLHYENFGPHKILS